MTAWISYAQNREDVLLRRAFADVPKGFYIDVGACDPVDLSITKHFYDAGWSGINIEASPVQWKIVARDRVRDINLNVGCSNQRGSMKFYVARGEATGLSTFSASEVEVHRKNGFEFDTITTSVMTLAEICEKHAGNTPIDFVTIDVEGHEREVLEGGDFRRFRPRVVVIEATRPKSTEPTHERWEELILRHEYIFATFDGLNRFYVRREDERLIPLLVTPPNVFDDFIPYEYKKEIDALQAEISAYRAAHAVIAGTARTLERATRSFGVVRRWFAR
jgi:heptosyltransferase-2